MSKKWLPNYVDITIKPISLLNSEIHLKHQKKRAKGALRSSQNNRFLSTFLSGPTFS